MIRHRRNDRIKHITALLLTAVILAGMLFSIRVKASNPDSQHIIRVGYVSMEGFLKENETGGYEGVGYELLKEVAMYLGWEYEFVEVPISDGFEMLKTGEIDFFTPVQKTEEREKSYQYSKRPICTNTCVLLALPDSPYYFNDFTHFQGATIATMADNRNTERVTQYLAGNDCVVNWKEYHTIAEQKEAMARQEVDMIMVSSNRGLSDTRIVAQLDKVDTYLISGKENESLMDKVDYALDQIALNTPELTQNLENEYKNDFENMYPSITREEREYLDQKESITLLVLPSDYDAENKKAIGGLQDFLDRLSDLMGISIQVESAPNLSALYERLQTGKTDGILTLIRDYQWAEEQNVWLTDTYKTMSMYLVRRTDTQEMNTIAVYGDSYMKFLLEEEGYQNLIDCEPDRECIDMVMEGKADACYANELTLNYYQALPRYNRLIFTTSYRYQNDYAVGISKYSDIELVSIFNKTLNCINEQEKMELFYSSGGNEALYTGKDYLYANPMLVIFVIVCFVILLFAGFMLVMYIRFMRKQNIQLEQAYAEKNNFLAAVSHDMRTPMVTILGLSEFGEAQPEGVGGREYFKQIHEAGHYLLSLINDTLDISKMSNRKMILHKESVSLKKLVEDIEIMIKAFADNKGIELQIQYQAKEELWIVADEQRLKQICVNLLNNAVKYTPEGGKVVFGIYEEEQSGQEVTIRFVVADNGIGISKEFQEKLYRPFEQESEMVSMNKGGTGLGLSIVKNLVDIMQGSILVESKKHEGTEFTVKISFEQGSRKEEDAVATGQWEKLRGKRVLVVEDHPVNRCIVVKLLNDIGIVTEETENGKEAVERFHASVKGTYDAILMDIRMPVMNGLEATKAIRRGGHPDALRIPVIAFSANAFDEDILGALESGMNDHIAKPVERKQLYEILKRCIKS